MKQLNIVVAQEKKYILIKIILFIIIYIIYILFIIVIYIISFFTYQPNPYI